MERTYRLLARDVDFNGLWMPAAIFTRMQEMGEEHAAEYNLGRMTIIEDYGIVWAITRMHLRMERYPRLAQEIRARTWALEPTKAWFRRHYSFADMEGNALGVASSQWVLLDLEDRILRRPSVIGPYPFDAADQPALEEPRKISFRGDMDLKTVRKVLYSDVDMNGHMNNTRYLNWICELFPTEFLREFQLHDVRINYVAEARIDQEVELYMAQADDGYYISGRTDAKNVFDAYINWQTIKEN